MIKAYLYSLLLLIVVTGEGCSVFCSSSRVVKKAMGVVMIPDLDSFKREGGHLYLAAPLPKLFIECDFNKGSVSEIDVVNSFFRKEKEKGDFLYLYDDCGGEKTGDLIKESVSLFLDDTLDSASNIRKVYLLPVIIEYLREEDISTSYYRQQKHIEVHSSNKIKEFILRPGYLNVTRLEVLEYDWPSEFKPK